MPLAEAETQRELFYIHLNGTKGNTVWRNGHEVMLVSYGKFTGKRCACLLSNLTFEEFNSHRFQSNEVGGA